MTMRPETRSLVHDLTIKDVCTQLDVSARAAAWLVERGLLSMVFSLRGLAMPTLDDARFRSDQVTRLRDLPGELARARAAHPRRTVSYDRALALGALLAASGR